MAKFSGPEWRGLTLTQPWAEAVALGHKQWETRSWTTRYRGLLAIHAAQGFPDSARKFAEQERALGRIPARIARGAIIATARLVDVRPTDEVAIEVSGLERHLGDFSPGRWAWKLADVVRLEEPIGARGSLGLWRPDEETTRVLTASLEVAA